MEHDEYKGTRFALSKSMRRKWNNIIGSSAVAAVIGLFAVLGVSKYISHQDHNSQRQIATQTDYSQNQSVVGDAFNGLDTITIPAARIDKVTDYDIVSTRFAKRQEVLSNKELASVEIPPTNYVGTPKQFNPQGELKTKEVTKIPNVKRQATEEKVKFASSSSESSRIKTESRHSPKGEYMLQASTLEGVGMTRDENGKFLVNGNLNGNVISYNIGHCSNGSYVYGITFTEKDSQGNIVRRNLKANEYGIVEIPIEVVEKNEKVRLFAGSTNSQGEIKFLESDRLKLNYDKENFVVGPTISSLKGSLEYQIANEDFWIGRNNLERNVTDTSNYTTKDSVQEDNANNKYKFNKSKFSDYDSFKEDYLNGEDSLKSIANKYGMGASTASRLGKDIFGCLGRESARRINGVYSTRRKGRSKKDYLVAA